MTKILKIFIPLYPLLSSFLCKAQEVSSQREWDYFVKTLVKIIDPVLVN